MTETDRVNNKARQPKYCLKETHLKYKRSMLKIKIYKNIQC